MKESIKQQVAKKVKEYLENKPKGARYSEIIEYLKTQFPNTSVKTLHGSMWELRQSIINRKEKEISIPEKGIYILSKYLQAGELYRTYEEIKKIKEEDFYGKFAEYLVNELEECTSAIPLGGNKFQDKWGTPDVLGVYKFSEADPIKPPLEIVSAEIKIDTNQLITAFGQACSYKVFSHKVYLVIPKQAGVDIPRLESLCLRFGIGLILFDKDNPEDPNFQIRTRAVKTDPDYYYVNIYIQKLDRNEIKRLLG